MDDTYELYIIDTERGDVLEVITFTDRQVEHDPDTYAADLYFTWCSDNGHNADDGRYDFELLWPEVDDDYPIDPFGYENW